MNLLQLLIPKLYAVTYVPVSGVSKMVIEFPLHIDIVAAEAILFAVLILILATPFLFESKTKKENV